MNIDDLPQHLLVEILCRLPSSKIVFQCKCVSRRWFALISDPYFVLRFVSLQKCTTDDVLVQRDADMDAILFYFNNLIHGRYLIWDYFVMAALPAKCKSRNLSLSFLPCFDQTTLPKPRILGTYNDLILCSTTWEEDYYICNPYTRQWIALPPTPQVHSGPVIRGFMCDHPYYNHEELVGNRTSSNNIKLNAEYRYRVVRITAVQENCFQENYLEFTVEIYSSETGEWRESVISSSRGFSFIPYACTPGVAYNGMLYWLSSDGLLIGVDPFNNINSSISTGANTTGDIVVNNESCRFVQFHKPEYNIEYVQCLGVCQGRLRMCHYDMEDPFKRGIVCVWELKEVEEDDQKADGIAGRLMKWCLIKKLVLDEMVAENPDIAKWRAEAGWWWLASVRAFDPNDEDILYLYLDEDIVACNFRTRTSFTRQRTDSEFHPWAKANAFPLSLKRWPTPLPN
ncbi:uncharacterized protein LOC110769083 [Prunus avium]|uniref:Uncharacterized protein LOC110769083 n=1 Tax=Prunus avium TaxID=42229 RepID=A0A6P5TM35_PRUAV|nr:uncharacterized protein LOC110769083 [Prunus avium]